MPVFTDARPCASTNTYVLRYNKGRILFTVHSGVSDGGWHLEISPKLQMRVFILIASQFGSRRKLDFKT